MDNKERIERVVLFIVGIILYAVVLVCVYIVASDCISLGHNNFILKGVDVNSIVKVFIFSSIVGYVFFSYIRKKTPKKTILYLIITFIIIFLPIVYQIYKVKQSYMLLNNDGITYHTEDGIFSKGEHIVIAWDSIYSIGYDKGYKNTITHYLRVGFSRANPKNSKYLNIASKQSKDSYIDLMERLAKCRFNKYTGYNIVEYSYTYTISAECQNMKTGEITNDSTARIVDIFWFFDKNKGSTYIINGKRYFHVFLPDGNVQRYATKRSSVQSKNYFVLEENKQDKFVMYKEYRNGVCYARKMKEGDDPTFGVK